jgi:hypothetical protein
MTDQAASAANWRNIADEEFGAPYAFTTSLHQLLGFAPSHQYAGSIASLDLTAKIPRHVYLGVPWDGITSHLPWPDVQTPWDTPTGRKTYDTRRVTE